MGLILQIQSFIEANECKESFAEKSFKWLRMLVKCVQFDKITNRSQLGHVDGLFDESKIVANHWKKMKQKVLHSILEYCINYCLAMINIVINLIA